MDLSASVAWVDPARSRWKAVPGQACSYTCDATATARSLPLPRIVRQSFGDSLSRSGSDGHARRSGSSAKQDAGNKDGAAAYGKPDREFNVRAAARPASQDVPATVWHPRRPNVWYTLWSSVQRDRQPDVFPFPHPSVWLLSEPHLRRFIGAAGLWRLRGPVWRLRRSCCLRESFRRFGVSIWRLWEPMWFCREPLWHLGEPI
mmetsp:Transcript_84/g.328  ORF Transcript_84/g.328 Transcript_84/m.328 type:complete len:203 (-) Transcript_84:758-1366(-)